MLFPSTSIPSILWPTSLLCSLPALWLWFSLPFFFLFCSTTFFQLIFNGSVWTKLDEKKFWQKGSFVQVEKKENSKVVTNVYSKYFCCYFSLKKIKFVLDLDFSQWLNGTTTNQSNTCSKCLVILMSDAKLWAIMIPRLFHDCITFFFVEVR